jgi:tellurium resistance protein TerD
MTISLEKGQKVDLTKTHPGLKKIRICLGWDIKKFDAGTDFDLDALAFLLNKSGKMQNEKDFVFYNNLKHESGGIIHSGDNRTGAGEGDDEIITVEFNKVPSNIDKIVFAITIFKAEERKQNFGMVNNSFVRTVDADTDTELLRYNLGEEFSIETGVVICEVYRYNNEWKFGAIGSGYKGGLEALIKSYGPN